MFWLGNHVLVGKNIDVILKDNYHLITKTALKNNSFCNWEAYRIDV